MAIRIQVIGGDVIEKLGRAVPGKKEKFLSDLTTVANAFGLDAVAIAKRDYLRGPKPDKLDSKGLLKSHINTSTARNGNTITTKVGSDLPYARIHEFGGTIPITKKMIGFMWHRFKETRDDKWKWLALGLRKKSQIVMPQRPYLRPAIKDAMPSFRDNIARLLLKLDFSGKNG